MLTNIRKSKKQLKKAQAPQSKTKSTSKIWQKIKKAQAPQSKKSRCPNGFKRNKKTGECYERNYHCPPGLKKEISSRGSVKCKDPEKACNYNAVRHTWKTLNGTKKTGCVTKKSMEKCDPEKKSVFIKIEGSKSYRKSCTKFKVGSYREVFNETAEKTSGGLTKDDLMQNKRGKIVSVAKHKAGLERWKKLPEEKKEKAIINLYNGQDIRAELEKGKDLPETYNIKHKRNGKILRALKHKKDEEKEQRKLVASIIQSEPKEMIEGADPRDYHDYLENFEYLKQKKLAKAKTFAVRVQEIRKKTTGSSKRREATIKKRYGSRKALNKKKIIDDLEDDMTLEELAIYKSGRKRKSKPTTGYTLPLKQRKRLDKLTFADAKPPTKEQLKYDPDYIPKL